MTTKPKDVSDIVALWLSANGYDGLTEQDGECACVLDDLAPCGEMRATCIAGFRGACRCGDHDFHIYPTRTAAERADTEAAAEAADDGATMTDPKSDGLRRYAGMRVLDDHGECIAEVDMYDASDVDALRARHAVEVAKLEQDNKELREDAVSAIAEVRGEITKLNERFPCGHRKADLDDSYGRCVACTAIAAMHESDGKDARIAELESLYRELETAINDGHDHLIIAVKALRGIHPATDAGKE